jgi:hypothetical protein
MGDLLKALLERFTSPPPKDPELESQIEQMIQPHVEKGYRGELSLPFGRPALGQPSLERAAHVLSKTYPKDMQGVEFGYEPNLDLTNILAHVPWEDGKQAFFNPSFAAVGTDEQIQSTAAHELQHIRDMKKGNISKYEGLLPWEKRPSEQRAMKAEEAFDKVRKPGTHDGVDEFVYRNFFDWVRSSPNVKEWLKDRNK